MELLKKAEYMDNYASAEQRVEGLGKSWIEQRKQQSPGKKANQKIFNLEIQYQGLADEISPLNPAQPVGALIGMFFTVDAMQCRKYLKKRGK